MPHKITFGFLDTPWLLLVFVVMISVARLIYKVMKNIEIDKRRKIDDLNKALQCNFVTGLTREYLQERIATEHFKICTSMSVEKKRREYIIRSYKNLSEKLSFSHFERALPYLVVEDKGINVKITMADKFFYIINGISGILLILCSIGVLFFIKYFVGFDREFFVVFFGFVAISVFSLAFGVFMFWQNFPISSAMRIHKLVMKMHSS